MCKNVFNLLKPGGVLFGLNGACGYGSTYPKFSEIFVDSDGNLDFQESEEKVVEFGQVWFKEINE